MTLCIFVSGFAFIYLFPQQGLEIGFIVLTLLASVTQFGLALDVVFLYLGIQLMRAYTPSQYNRPFILLFLVCYIGIDVCPTTCFLQEIREPLIIYQQGTMVNIRKSPKMFPQSPSEDEMFSPEPPLTPSILPSKYHGTYIRVVG